MHTLEAKLAASLNSVVVPDLWQQQAVTALREGKDVVVHAPTGAGKTLIFELWSNQGKNRGQAIYTVPTRALANDKLAEWRGRGWEVGIATGDLSENLDAPVLVATLETQKRRLIQGEGPALLVVDEYQMIGDSERGLNYELALAMAPRRTQLLLLSGSVANPQDVVKWLRRLGRQPVLVRHEVRPVPLEEVDANHLNYHLPGDIRGYWPRLIAKALAEDLGPILIFSPRRQATESLAAELTRYLPNPNPLTLSLEQKQLVEEHLARLLKCRIAYHHSGLSYGARAGVIEPLAKAGQLRVVVSTMGLASGINFSLRSVALAAESYSRDSVEQILRPHEILQMFGRAGRRGIDETGYVIVTANGIHLRDAYPCQLARSGLVDWSALLGLMTTAAQQQMDPFAAAVRAQERLFTIKPIVLGVEVSLQHPQTPCGLKTDAERARHVRSRVRQLRNSLGGWESYPAPLEKPLREIVFYRHGVVEARPEGPERAERSSPSPAGLPMELKPVLSNPEAVAKIGSGTLYLLSEEGSENIYGRAITVAEHLNGERVLLAKWVRRVIDWDGRQASSKSWRQLILPRLEDHFNRQKTPLVRFLRWQEKEVALVSIAELPMRVPVDSRGVALWHPQAREVPPADCSQCSLVPECRQLPTATGVALLWRRLGLVDAAGVPSLRGQVASYFSQGDGLAIASALEDASYPLEELIYDLANLEGGFRFCGDENRWAGRLARACQQRFGLQSIPGYLENGVPANYGAGPEHIVAANHKNPLAKQAWVTDLLGAGDIDRMIIEWRSLLRQIAHAPDLDWPRWRALRIMAREILSETQSPTLTDLPPLEYLQTRRVNHQLQLRRH